MNWTVIIKKVLLLLSVICLFSLPNNLIDAQPVTGELENLRIKYREARNDSLRIKILIDITYYFTYINGDSALIYAQKAYDISKNSNNLNIIEATTNLGTAYDMVGDFENAVKYNLEAFQQAQKLNNRDKLSDILTMIAYDYLMIDTAKAEEYCNRALHLSRNDHDRFYALAILAQIMVAQNRYAQAHKYYNESAKLAENLKLIYDLTGVYAEIGELYSKEKDYNKSLYYLNKAIKIMSPEDFYHKNQVLYATAVIYSKTGNYKESIKTALQADTLVRQGRFNELAMDINLLLSQVYDSLRLPAFAYDYYKKYIVYKDSIVDAEKTKHVRLLQAKFETKQKELKIENLQVQAAFHRKMTYVYFVVSTLVLLALFYFIKYLKQKNQRLKMKKDLAELQVENKEIENRQLLDAKKIQELELHNSRKEISMLTLNFISNNETLGQILKIVEKEKKFGGKNKDASLEEIRKLAFDYIDPELHWKKFRHTFDHTNPGYVDRLKAQYQGLSEYEIKLCAYISVGLKSEEIAKILNITTPSVNKSRNRLRKKLLLTEEVNLAEFLGKM